MLHPGGEVTWTSPAGLEYLTRPAPVVRFVDAEDARRARSEHVRRGDVGREESAEKQDPAGRQGTAQRPTPTEDARPTDSHGPADGASPTEHDDPQARARTRRAMTMLRTGDEAKTAHAWATLAAAYASTTDTPF
ncbi:hypothetical protein CZ774_04365 [Frigoribacterium sp. JB110]|nr:hypothetical protein CZ774_04365 [Frigoribacterium sp. JB110]